MFIPKLEALAYFKVSILKRKDINELVRCDILKECFKNINELSKFYKFKCLYDQNKSIKLDLIQL